MTNDLHHNGYNYDLDLDRGVYFVDLGGGNIHEHCFEGEIKAIIDREVDALEAAHEAWFGQSPEVK